MMKYGIVRTFRVDEELDKAITQQATIEDRSIGQMIRTLVKRGLAATTKGLDWEGRKDNVHAR